MSKIDDEGSAEIGETIFPATESKVIAGMVI